MTTDTVVLLQSIYTAQTETNVLLVEAQRVDAQVWGSILAIGLVVLWIGTWTLRGKV